MPRKAIDYNKTIIYKIQHKENNELLYVGHTTDFTKRKNQHKSNSISNKFKVYQMIRENDGWEAFNMVMVEEFPCENKLQACKREDDVMRELKASMNSYGSIFNKDKAVEHMKQYRDSNRDKILEQQKQYKEANRDELAEQRKKYREANRDKLAEESKNYYEANRNKLLEKQKQYKEANRDILSDKQKRWYEANREKIAERRKLYREANREKHIEYMKQYHAKKKGNIQ